MGFFEKLFKKKTAPVVSSPDKAVAESKPDINITITTRSAYKERKPVGELSHLDFGKPSGVLGCFLNYAPHKLYEPSEKQFNYLRDLGVVVPAGVTNIDASYMISRAEGEDDIEGPSSEHVALAAGLGTKFSAFVGASGLLRDIIAQASDRERAALYIYGVRQNVRGRRFGNMLEDPELSVFYNFADVIVSDASLLRSLNGRAADDYMHPYKGTAIYKAAADFLKKE